MKHTNKHNLPGPLFRALALDRYSHPTQKHDISVTSLIGPPRIFQLKKRHWDEIEVDASKNLWSMFGSALHYICESMEGMEEIAEERLYMEVNGWHITGQSDLYEQNGTLSDVKFTSVWSLLFGTKPEWAEQLNLNALLFRHAGFEVNKVQNLLLLRDWSRHKARTDRNYPSMDIVIKEHPLWDQSEQLKFAEARVIEHQKAAELADDDLPLCTPKERWERGEEWAIFKQKGGKQNVRATKVLKKEAGCSGDDALAEARAMTLEAKAGEAFIVKHRPGENVRCLDFCDAADFCWFGKRVKAEREAAEVQR